MIPQRHQTLLAVHTKNIKKKKIKDILLQDIKNDVSEFIKNEIKQKLDLHNTTRKYIKLSLIKE